MPTAVLKKTTGDVVEEAIGVVQQHLDREAKRRGQPSLQPKDLCRGQKSALVDDLGGVLRD